MSIFTWEGRTRTGEPRQGVMEAPNDAAVVQRLRDQNIVASKIKRKPREISLQIGTGIAQRDVVVFARQFATMIDSGLPLVQCLEILGNQADNKTFGKLLAGVRERVEGGASLSDALRGHPRIFDDLFVNMVQAGEVGGVLDTILNRLAIYMEKSMRLKAKVKGAMVYPVAISAVAVIVIVILLWKVIPVFEKMFLDMGAGALPGLTQMVITLSRAFVSNVHLIFMGGAAIAVGYVAAMRTRRGKRLAHIILLRLPLIGSVLRKMVVARFSRTFGTLLASGVPILDSMEICARTSGNIVIEEAINEVRARVAEGKDVAGPLGKTNTFPPMVVQMIAVGEQTGNMDQMLQKIADFYEEEVDVAVAALTSLMEPMMMVVLGGVVGFILIAMYLPIFELGGSIRGG
ncbi:MAG: type II secretion system F family protein [Proteobacteria bacterium]|nr:type II secretion system F family protein [Pseudomonadota bacterium]